MMKQGKLSLGIARVSAAVLGWIGGGLGNAMTITGYSSAVNDRFSSGYPSAPVENTNPLFVGLGLDWDGVGWASSDGSKSFGFLSPAHYLVARHYAGAPSITTFVNGALQTNAQSGVEDIGYGVVFQGQTVGDLSVGTLATPVTSVGMPRYGVLDLNATSTTNSPTAYNSLNVLLTGRGVNGLSSTRIGETSVASVGLSGNNQYFLTSRTDVQLEAGDSGSPAFSSWTNPNGVQELALIGNNAAINDTWNFINFLGTIEVMSGLNLKMNDDGYALRVVGNATHTWVGSANTAIGTNRSWGLSGQAATPTDTFVTFDGATAGNNRVVNVSSNHNLRGLYFKSSAALNNGFSFSGSSTLTIGRGGMTNYDESRQVISNALALSDSQLWNGGVGGITAGAINTGGKLLEISGTGINRITGIISGTGGALAVSEGTLELSGANTYTGKTWVHGGASLKVNNTTGSGTGSGGVFVASGATLGGTGGIGGVTTISGILAPGSGMGRLTVNNDVIWNGGGAWLFELGTAAESMAAAGAALGLSSQDVLMVAGNGSDFMKGSGSSWKFDFAGGGENGWYRLVDWDGTTNFTSGNFLATNLQSGRTGSFLIDSGTSALYLSVVPEPSAAVLLLVGLLPVWKRRRCVDA